MFLQPQFGGNQIRRDPYLSSVKLLMHCDGSNGGTSFVDSSPSGRSLTAGGSMKTVTSSPTPKFGTACITDAADNTGNITMGSSADLSQGTADFSFEFWLNCSSNAGASIFWNGTTGVGSFAIGTTSRAGNYDMSCYFDETTDFRLNQSCSLNVWTFFCLIRRSGMLEWWRDGVLTAQTACTSNFASNSLKLGKTGSGSMGNTFQGCAFDEIRYTKGVARDIASTGIPAAPFPNI